MKRKTLLYQISFALLFLGLMRCSILDRQSRPTDLAGIDQLKSRFNQDKGVARLVLLVSPT